MISLPSASRHTVLSVSRLAQECLPAPEIIDENSARVSSTGTTGMS